VHLVDGVWPSVTKGFQRASARFGGDLTVGELWQLCRSGYAFLFVVHDDREIVAATAWRPEQWGSGPKFRCLALYGKGMSDWMPDLHEKVRQTAIQCGAASLMSDGRVGWKKVFPGAKVLRAVYEEPIDGR
jgi:hypothetical protein